MYYQKDATRLSLRRSAWRRVSTIVLLATISLSPPLSAQVQANFQAGEVGNWQRAIIALMARAEQISAEAGAIHISPEYCTIAQRNAAEKPLIAVERKMQKLRDDYMNLKSRTRSLAQRQAVAKQWEAYGADPGLNNFWKIPDDEVLNHPQADINIKRTAFDASIVKPCNSQPRNQQVVAPPPPVTPPNAAALIGMSRPPVPPMAPVPDLPPPFCSYTELWKWHDEMLKAQMKIYADASWDLMKYSQAIIEAMTKARDAGDAAALRVLRGELDWVGVEHARMDAAYWELAKLRDRLTVRNCNPPTQTEPPKGTSETGFNWSVGGSVHYASFSDFRNVAGDQYSSTGVTGSTGTTGWGVSLGVNRGRITCGGSYNRNRINYTQTYNAPEINYAIRTEGEMTGQFFDLSCGPKLKFRRATFTGLFGFTYAVNYLEGFDEFSNAQIVPIDRTLKGWKTNFGARVDFPVYRDIDLRLQYTATQGGFSGDADRNNRLEFGLGYRFTNFRF